MSVEGDAKEWRARVSGEMQGLVAQHRREVASIKECFEKEREELARAMAVEVEGMRGEARRRAEQGIR